MIQRILLLSMLLPLIILACSRNRPPGALPAGDQLGRADQLAAEGDWGEAVMAYEELLSSFPPPEVAERAKFNLARCRVELKDYDLAISEFEDFVDDYPQSALADDAMYMIGVCYLAQSLRPERDQQNTLKAVEELEFMLREYPDSNVREAAEASLLEARSKLARKEYMNGKLDLRMGHYRAARVYFDMVANDYADTEWAAWALLGKGQSFDREGNMPEAVEVYRQVITRYPGTEPSGRSAMRLDQIAGGGGDESDR